MLEGLDGHISLQVRDRVSTVRETGKVPTGKRFTS